MSDTTRVEMHDRAGRRPETKIRHYQPGDLIIPARLPVNRIYTLAEGTVRIEAEDSGRKKPLLTELTGSDVGSKVSWAILGAKHFFLRRLSPDDYRAMTGCMVYTYDSRMFGSRDSFRATIADLIPIAIALVSNSDLSEKLIPKIASEMNICLPEKPARRELTDILRIMLRRKNEEEFQRRALRSLYALIMHRQKVTDQPSLIGARAMVKSRARAATLTYGSPDRLTTKR